MEKFTIEIVGLKNGTYLAIIKELLRGDANDQHHALFWADDGAAALGLAILDLSCSHDLKKGVKLDIQTRTTTDRSGFGLNGFGQTAGG